MKRLNLLHFAHLSIMVFLLSGEAFADRDAEIRDLKFEKEKLNSEIQKLNRQIASTDSMLKADDSRYKMLSQRYKADTDRRRAEIDSLNTKIRGVAEQLQVERSKQARAKNRGDNVAAKRKALREALAGISKRLEAQVAQTVPWEMLVRVLLSRSAPRPARHSSSSPEV